MLNLLRRSKNKRAYRQDIEEPSNYPANECTSATITGQNLQPPQHRIHGKCTATKTPTIDDLEDFNDLEEKPKALQEKHTQSDEREACFAKIYFEDAETLRNVNVATSKTTAPTTLTAAKKSVSLVGRSYGAHDALNTATKQYSDIKKTNRKSLGFRKVDLDGVNSVIEAILPTSNANNGEHCCEHVQQSDSGEHSNVICRSLSQNERAEWSGHNPSQLRSSKEFHQIVNDTVNQAESYLSQSTKVFNNCESVATKTNSTANVRNQCNDQNQLNTASDAATPQLVNSTEVLSKNSKQIKAARRRSYFQRKNSQENATIESSTTPKIQDESPVIQKVDDKKGHQGPLQKGKKLLTDIFMARGRQHTNQRNRNQTQITTKQPQQEPCTANQSNAAVTTDHNDCQNAIDNKDKTTISETRNNFIADNQNKSIDRAPVPIIQTKMLRRHLETSNSRNNYRDPTASTNQMTLSNNSGKNASHRDVNADGEEYTQQMRSHVRDRGNSLQQHQRSNSAEHHRERREQHSMDATDIASNYERACSEEPRTERRRWSGALRRDFVRVPFGKEEPTSTSSDVKMTEPFLIRAGITEQNGIEAHKIHEEDNCLENNNTTGKQFGCDSTVELTACERDRQKLSTNRTTESSGAVANAMGQTYSKNVTAAEESRASTAREFHEAQIPETVNDLLSVNGNGPKVGQPLPLPKITVVDCSAGTSSGSNSDCISVNKIPVEHEIFYEFESESPTTNSVKHMKLNSNVQIEDLDSDDDDADDTDDDDDDVFHEQVSKSQPTHYTTYRHHSPLRHSPIILEDVPEQEEDESNGDHAATTESLGVNVNDFSRHNRTRHGNSTSLSPERGPLKSCDSNLSNSYTDSGISGCSESLLDSPERNNASQMTAATTTASNTKTSISRSSLTQRRQRSPFVRDSTSTDCDETLLQCDDLDCFASPSTSTTTVIDGGGERLVCIESISLPDVVESTTSSPSIGNGHNNSNSSAVASGGIGGGEHIININGATGNAMGNVHFIPIHIEGGGTRDSSPHQQQKRRSIDDSVIGSGMKGSRFAHLNELSSKPTIEIVDEDDCCKTNINNNTDNNDIKTEKMRLELQEQKARLGAQLEDAHKNVQNLQTKINDMQTKIVNLEQELSLKTWNVERLQSELNATQREDEFVRKKLRLLEEEKTGLRQKFDESEDEFRRKYEELETKYNDLEEKYKNTQKLTNDLQQQLASAQSEAEHWRDEVEKIRTELEEQIRILQSAFENSEAERKICEDKWQKEFEMLRTQHMDREETLMSDCEWQLRQMQKQWKDKLDKADHARNEAVDTAELMGLELEARKQEVNSLRQYESEVKSLRGAVSEQHNCIETLMNQIENLKTELLMANEKLEEQIEAVKKIKYQCDNTLCDKERQMVYRIDEVRNEAAYFWENKLHTEMTRLTHELESVYVEERREALDKLQTEHIEEIRALTNRYTANEEELRTELAELQESYDHKSEEFLELRQKTDNALLQTRMHLDRADREYQNAMCREEERREALEATLRKEFEEEKEEMENQFQKRLEQVKEKLLKELEDSKQEMTQKHKKDLEQQRAKLRAEKDKALQELTERHRTKLATAEEQIRDIELRHQRDLNELKATYDGDKAVLDKRDISNANEIEQLHRRCRCLTNLFEEMRMRYERRDPRPEDLREIEELRTRCESQERDLFTLTTTLREMQMQMSNLQQNDKSKKNCKTIQKPPPKTIPMSCDVIYEENEERDSPPPQRLKSLEQQNGVESDSNDENADHENYEHENEEEDVDDEEEENHHSQRTSCMGNKLVNGSISEVH